MWLTRNPETKKVSLGFPLMDLDHVVFVFLDENAAPLKPSEYNYRPNAFTYRPWPDGERQKPLRIIRPGDEGELRWVKNFASGEVVKLLESKDDQSLIMDSNGEKDWVANNDLLPAADLGENPHFLLLNQPRTFSQNETSVPPEINLGPVFLDIGAKIKRGDDVFVISPFKAGWVPRLVDAEQKK